jgi:hypothetical protein
MTQKTSKIPISSIVLDEEIFQERELITGVLVYLPKTSGMGSGLTPLRWNRFLTKLTYTDFWMGSQMEC